MSSDHLGLLHTAKGFSNNGRITSTCVMVNVYYYVMKLRFILQIFYISLEYYYNCIALQPWKHPAEKPALLQKSWCFQD